MLDFISIRSDVIMEALIHVVAFFAFGFTLGYRICRLVNKRSVDKLASIMEEHEKLRKEHECITEEYESLKEGLKNNKQFWAYSQSASMLQSPENDIYHKAANKLKKDKK